MAEPRAGIAAAEKESAARAIAVKILSIPVLPVMQRP
jgi:hypothetical protein